MNFVNILYALHAKIICVHRCYSITATKNKERTFLNWYEMKAVKTNKITKLL